MLVTNCTEKDEVFLFAYKVWWVGVFFTFKVFIQETKKLHSLTK